MAMQINEFELYYRVAVELENEKYKRIENEFKSYETDKNNTHNS